jgi:hypothetical protein
VVQEEVHRLLGVAARRHESPATVVAETPIDLEFAGERNCLERVECWEARIETLPKTT